MGSLAAPWLHLDVYTDDTKASRVNTNEIKRVQSASYDATLNTIPQHSIDVILGDPATQLFSQNNYVELSAGYTAPVLALSGYVLNFDRHGTEDGVYTITVEDALKGLEDFTNLGNFEATYGMGYQSVLDFLNGIHGAGVPATPGTMGLLDGTNWTAVWVGTGSPPGLGDNWAADWASCWANVLNILTHYSLFARAGAGSKRKGGTLEIGPLNDLNSISIIGGKPLLIQQQATYDPNMEAPNSAFAQNDGVYQIVDAGQSQDNSKIANVVFGVGYGSYQNLVTTKELFGKVFNGNGTMATGVTTWPPAGTVASIPHGRVYYIKTASRTTWQGHTYYQVAAQQNDGQFAYGVVDITSAQKYGVIEEPHVDKTCHDGSQLLSSILGFLESGHDPVDTWTFVIQDPMNTANAAPAQIFPGQRLTNVQYTGWTADAIEFDATGQPFGVGEYDWLHFPLSTEVDADTYANAMRIIEVQTSFDSSGAKYTLTLGKVKRNKRRTDAALMRKMLHQHYGTKIHRNRTTPVSMDGVHWLASQNPTAYVGIGTGFTGDQWLIPPGAWIMTDVADGSTFPDNRSMSFRLNISDINQVVDIVFDKPPLSGTLGQFDLSGETDASGNKLLYGMLRISCFGASTSTTPNAIYTIGSNTFGQRSGFYTTDGGFHTALLSHQGGLNSCKLLNSTGQLPAAIYDLTLYHSQGYHTATIQVIDPATGSAVGSVYHLAHWTDNLNAGGPWLTQKGAFGIHVWGGSSTVEAGHFHSAAYHHHITTRGHQHESTHGKHHWQNVVHYPTSQSTAGGVTTVFGLSNVNGGTGFLMDQAMQPIVHESDGTPVQITTNTAWSGQPGDFLVYNAGGVAIPDGRGGSIPIKSFGGVASFDANLPANNQVFQIGRITTQTDTSGTPWLTGGRAGELGVTSVHLANANVLYNVMTAHGDMIYGGTVTSGHAAPTRLPFAAGSALVSGTAASATPQWATPTVGGSVLVAATGGNPPFFAESLSLSNNLGPGNTVIQGAGTAGTTGVTGISDTNVGVYGSTTGGTSGVYGIGGASGYGVYGTNAGQAKPGVAGFNDYQGASLATSGIGVYGEAANGVAVYGSTGGGVGVYGYANSANGIGVSAYADTGGNTALTAQALGTNPIFKCFNATGAVVFEVDQSGPTTGLPTFVPYAALVTGATAPPTYVTGSAGSILTANGTSAAPSFDTTLALSGASGAIIEGNATSGAVGVQGSTDSGSGVYGSASGAGNGVYGVASGAGDAIYGSATSGTAVFGIATSGYAVYGTTTSGAAAVYGNAAGTGVAVYGNATANGHGVSAYAAGTAAALTAQNTGTGDLMVLYNSANTPIFAVNQSGVYIGGAPTPNSLVNGGDSFSLNAFGHLESAGGSAPSVTSTVGLGTGGTASVSLGDDKRFRLHVATGTGTATPNTSVTVTFANAYASTAYIPVVSNSSGHNIGVCVSAQTSSAVTFTLFNLVDSTSYDFSVIILA